ncbi:MAG: MBL fold metallo-hydrolase [Bryobacteraceae bacterium]
MSARTPIERLDAILFTHEHADHIMGLDDVRPFNFRQKGQIPIFASERTMRRSPFLPLHLRHGRQDLERPATGSHTLNSSFDLFGVEITPVPVLHGRATVYGFRFRKAAYLTDHGEIRKRA